VGSAKLEWGQSVATEQGKAEILLTPGAFLRLGDNTSVKMISSGLTNTQVEVQKGRAIVEVAEIHDENNLRVDLNGATTRILKKGLYDFDVERNQVRVFDGRATVQENGAQVEVKEKRELTLDAGDSLRTEKFDKKTYQEQEARAASALNHPNILTIFEIGEANGAHYIATEFIDGQTLREWLSGERLAPAAALEIATQIAAALAAAHEAGIVHRDIKPENVMLRRDGIVKVLDFGLAKLIEQRPAGTLSPDGRWLAYVSDVSGRMEVYMQSFPDGGGKRQVSTGGGKGPRWRRDGRELFYYSLEGKLMAVPVRSGENFDMDAAVSLFEFRAGIPPFHFAPYAVTADGQRFMPSAFIPASSTWRAITISPSSPTVLGAAMRKCASNA
jgi:serine/threonine protein kinase